MNSSPSASVSSVVPPDRHVRLGLVGLGVMGAAHAREILAGRAGALRLAAIAERDTARHAAYPGVPAFADHRAMFASGEIDAVLIATPHHSHADLVCEAFAAGLHVLVEKPLAVQKTDALRAVAAHRDPSRVFGIMLNQRTNELYARAREWLRDGTTGPVQRFHWTCTRWFRPDAYFAASPWRGTWAGEGGGVLLNQAIHQLDLLCWIFGSPRRVHAFCQFGRHHAIEVEDEVTAYLEFAGGATGVFTTSTGEAPGRERLEIAGDRACVVIEGQSLTLVRNAVPAAQFARTSPELFRAPAASETVVTDLGRGGQHNAILANFAAAILDGAPLLAPGADGVASLELANAMLLSTWLGAPVSLPLDAEVFSRHFAERVARSASPRSVPSA